MALLTCLLVLAAVLEQLQRVLVERCREARVVEHGSDHIFVDEARLRECEPL